MNVGDLKKYIADIPDKTMVVLSVDPIGSDETDVWCDGGNELDGMLFGRAGVEDLGTSDSPDAIPALFLFPAH